MLHHIRQCHAEVTGPVHDQQHLKGTGTQILPLCQNLEPTDRPWGLFSAPSQKVCFNRFASCARCPGTHRAHPGVLPPETGLDGILCRAGAGGTTAPLWQQGLPTSSKGSGRVGAPSAPGTALLSHRFVGWVCSCLGTSWHQHHTWGSTPRPGSAPWSTLVEHFTGAAPWGEGARRDFS